MTLEDILEQYVTIKAIIALLHQPEPKVAPGAVFTHTLTDSGIIELVVRRFGDARPASVRVGNVVIEFGKLKIKLTHVGLMTADAEYITKIETAAGTMVGR